MSTALARKAANARPPSLALVANFVGFQCGWFACVLGAGHGWALAGTAAAITIVALHVACASQPLREVKIVTLCVVLGALWDSALVSCGWIAFTSGTLIDGMAPPWILALWALFGTTLNLSLGWLNDKLLVAAVLGALAGPLSYWAGVRMGALEFNAALLALGALSIGWGVMTPLLIVAARRLARLQSAR